jgi:hypothetical protein
VVSKFKKARPRTSILIVVGTFLVLAAADNVRAHNSAALIELDRQWGEAGVKGDTSVAMRILADDLVSVTEDGVRGKQGELEDNEPAPAGTRYEPIDYRVTFLNADTAVMTHGTKGDNAHNSLHVWSRKGGNWKVVATSTTPVAAD